MKEALKSETMSNNRPKILCSACLEHCKCRYDGSVIENTTIKHLQPYVDFVTVCPEMGIGLPSPREAVRVARIDGEKRLIDSYSGTDRTEAMHTYIDAFLEAQEASTIDGVILKCKSPTCGFKDVKLYSGAGKQPSLPEKTSGFFGAAVKAKFAHVLVEDEGRLKHFNIREHFFMTVFLSSRFRAVASEVCEKQRLKPLVDFHSENKYLMMAYNQSALKKLGGIVANHEIRALEAVVEAYGETLSVIYNAHPSIGKNVNMLLHLFGYFKKGLTAEEKAFFLDQVSLYQTKKLPFSSVLSILHAWAIRFEETYLMQQTIFNMFPKALIEMTDSGKGL